MTSRGVFPKFSRVSFNSVSLTTMETALASKISRMVCCCGKISRPFGAEESIGTTRTTKSLGEIKSLTIGVPFTSLGRRVEIFSFNSRMWKPVFALISIVCSVCSARESVDFSGKSHLLWIIRYGICLSWIFFKMFSSSTVIPTELSITSRAMSVLFNIWYVFVIRNCPSSPSSSRPAVSINTTGPMGRSSIAFKTGSVVVPFVSDTMESACPVNALIKLDFPQFLLPKMPMWIRFAEGVLFKLI